MNGVTISLKGKVAVVTGAGKGIGYGIAKRLAEAGAYVILIARNKDNLQKAVKEITDAGGKAKAYSIDVTDLKAMEKMFEEVYKENGHIDVLVNNAGVVNFAQEDNMTEQLWDEVVDTDLKAPYFAMKYVLKYMEQQKSGKIINITSAAGQSIPGTAGSNYGAAKAGLINLTKQVAVNYSKLGIYCNAIACGVIDTDMGDRLPGHDFAVQVTPLGRTGKTNEVADTALYLATDMSSYMTGCTLSLSGGLFMQ